MDKPLQIGILHYSCPPVVGGVEEVLSQHAAVLHSLGQSVSILAGAGEVYTDSFPVRIEPVLGSRNRSILNAHEQSMEGEHKHLKRLTSRIHKILEDWSKDLDVILVHNVRHMPFNLPFTMAIHDLTASGDGPVIVSWAHDSPYLQPNYPGYLDHDPWEVINNGIDPADFFYLDPRSVRLAQELDAFSRDLILVQPSRTTPRKNLELAIHIIRGIKMLGHNVLFIMTGAYDPHEKKAVSYYRRLRYWIKELHLQENIAIPAEYRFKDGTRLVPDRVFIRDLYLMADLLLMTSKDEGFDLPLLEAGLAKLPIACTQIPAFLELGQDVCFYSLDDPPLSIAGRIMEYLAYTNTHKMFRSVMQNYISEIVCRRKIMPFLRDITSQKDAGKA